MPELVKLNDPLNRLAEQKLRELGEHPDPYNLPLLTLAEWQLQNGPDLPPKLAAELEDQLANLNLRVKDGPNLQRAAMRLLFLGEDRQPVAPLDPEKLQPLPAKEVAQLVLNQVVDALSQELVNWPPPERPPLAPNPL